MGRRTASAPSGGNRAAREPEIARFDLPLTWLKGVGPKKAAALAALSIFELGDLVKLVPAGLERIPPRATLKQALARRGQFLRIRATVRSLRLSRMPQRGTLLRIGLEDESGRLDAVYFNQPWQRERFPLDASLCLAGRVLDVKGLALVAPRLLERAEWSLPAGLALPLYPAGEGVSKEALMELCVRAREALVEQLEEPLDPAGLERLGLPHLQTAVAEILAADRIRLGRATAPEESDPVELRAHGLRLEAARRRLALEPLLELTARLLERRKHRSNSSAPVLAACAGRLDQLVRGLGFEPTRGQRQVIDELAQDLARAVPMRRLLQGDVGSGKTALGLVACGLAASAGHQALFLAPTELLAEQHFQAARGFLERTGLSAEVLTGSQKPARRRALVRALAEGRLDLVFGTHALLSDDVRLSRPGLAVIDEQHRFGVEQRRALLDKGEALHALLMTATPIPRTLAMTLYGDLDVSVLRELPPGRRAVQTRVVLRAERGRVLATFGERLERGERGFFVAPRIESNEQGRGVEELWEELAGGPLGRFGVELVHGRLPAPERERRLERFRRGESRLLVGTTVIEVGLDVPQATLIAIEGAERFGLAQLHQLRGRVGRGSFEGPWCFLIPERFLAPRLALLTELADGFLLAERDLELRGMGDLFGARQAGENQEGLAGDALDEAGFDAALLLFARETLERDPRALGRYLPSRGRPTPAP